MYGSGRGVRRDPARSRMWIARAAEARVEIARQWRAERPG